MNSNPFAALANNSNSNNNRNNNKTRKNNNNNNSWVNYVATASNNVFKNIEASKPWNSKGGRRRKGKKSRKQTRRTRRR